MIHPLENEQGYSSGSAKEPPYGRLLPYLDTYSRYFSDLLTRKKVNSQLFHVAKASIFAQITNK